MGKNTRPLPPHLAGKQGRGGATPVAHEAVGLGLYGASGGGEKREEEVGVRFPYLARAGVEQGGGGRERAAVATTALGGSAARPERRGTGAAWLVEVDGREERLFIGVARWWRGEAPVVAGRRPLMAPRTSRSGVTRDSRRRRDVSGSGTVSRRKASRWRGP